jgi:hypothetical protein
MEPKVLPCGETACSKCLDNEKCFFCNEQHEIQNLPTNKALARQCEQKRDKFKNLCDELLQCIDKINYAAYNLRENFPENRIAEEYSKVIASVETHRDLIIEKVKKNASELVQNLRNQETCSQTKIKESSKDKKAVVEDFIDELEYFYDSWTKKIANYDLESITKNDYDELSNAFSQVSDLFVDVDAAKDYLSLAVSFEKIQFVANTGILNDAHNTVGELSMPCNRSFQIDRFDDAFIYAKSVVNLDKVCRLIENRAINSINLSFFIIQTRPDLFFCFYLDIENRLNAFKFNNKGQVEEIYQSFYTNRPTLHFRVKYSFSNDKFILYTSKESPDKVSSRHVYILNADTMAIEHELDLKQKMVHFCLSHKHIFMVLLKEKCYQLVILDLKLNILKLFIQGIYIQILCFHFFWTCLSKMISFSYSLRS